MRYDLIVVGAGSAGSVLASRLSEDAAFNVLLIEAGPDYPTLAATPAEILDPSSPVVTGHNWSTKAHLRVNGHAETAARAGTVFRAGANRSAMIKAALAATLQGNNALSTFQYPVGKLVGGSSAVNGALAMRAPADDFREWVGLGNDAWAWSQVERFYRRAEGECETSEGERRHDGSNGTGVPIETITPEQFTPLQKDFFDICQTMGFSHRDALDVSSHGVGGVSRNTENEQRISTALAYLTVARHRPNLTIHADTLADKIIFDGDRAVGVQVQRNGRVQRLFGKSIVLSAGSLHSPGILLRSGVGPVAALENLGVKVVSGLPGVGKNLVDHPAVALWAIPKPGTWTRDEEMHQASLHFQAHNSTVSNDMQLFMLSAVDTRLFPELKAALGAVRALALSVVVAKPRSRGEVVLTGLDPQQQPKVILNCAEDNDDLQRLKHGIRLAWKILKSDPLAAKIDRVFAWNDKVVASDALLTEMIATFVRGSWHAVGTAKMGLPSDPDAVVDQYGQIHGCRSLHVADASIMPTITRTPPNLTTIMIAERIAEHWRARGVD